MDDENTRREKEVLMLIFGLNNKREMSLREVGDKLGITKERVRQVRDRALCKLRMQAEELEDFVVDFSPASSPQQRKAGDH